MPVISPCVPSFNMTLCSFTGCNMLDNNYDIELDSMILSLTADDISIVYPLFVKIKHKNSART